MSDERDWVAEEIAEVEARRERLLNAYAKNTHLDPWKADEQLLILNRQLDELRVLAA